MNAREPVIKDTKQNPATQGTTANRLPRLCQATSPAIPNPAIINDSFSVRNVLAPSRPRSDASLSVMTTASTMVTRVNPKCCLTTYPMHMWLHSGHNMSTQVRTHRPCQGKQLWYCVGLSKQQHTRRHSDDHSQPAVKCTNQWTVVNLDE